MMRTRPFLLIAFGLGLVCLAACSSTPPGPRAPVPTLEPLVVDGSTTAILTIADIYVSLEPDTRLGYNHEGAGNNRTYDYRWGPNLSAETDLLNDDVLYILADAGYRTVTWSKEKGAEEVPGQTVLELRPIIDQLELNSYSDAGGYSQAFCRVVWELYHPDDTKPLYTGVTSGYNRQVEHSAGIFQTAFERALMNVMADEGFVAAASTP
jgi:hypothetical protein